MKNLLKFAFTFFIFTNYLHAVLPARPDSFVTDEANLLDQQTKIKLEALLVELKEKTSAEVAVVTIQTLEGREISEFATQLFEKWGIGQKGKNNGILLLIAPQDKQVRIETGYGIEDIIPDALAGRIINDVIVPAFKQGQYSQGTAQAGAVIAGLIAQSANVQLTGGNVGFSERQPQRKATLGEKIFGLLFLIILIPIVIKNPWLLFFLLSSGRGGSRGGGFGGGGFGGFGGGMSGGGGASGRW